MPEAGRGRSRPASAVVLPLIAAVLPLVLLALIARPAGTAPARAAVPGPEGVLARPPAPWAEAAAAMRKGDLAAARRLVEPLLEPGSETHPAAAQEARVVLGLWAHAAENLEDATNLLRRAADSDGRFEDWRLLVLADCHERLGRLPAAAATLAQLLAALPDSPLRAPALLRATETARRLGDRQGALRLIAAGRREALAAAEAEALERSAWQLAVDSGDQELQRRLARRLLVRFPITASKLEVIELFRQPSGAIEWTAFLETDELLERAESLLAAGVTAGGLQALDAVPAAQRGIDWRLIRAAVLTAAHRGDEALELLRGVSPESPASAVRVEELRAAAAFEAAAVGPDGNVPPLAERQRLRREARAALRRVLELAGERPEHRRSALAACRRLLAELLGEQPPDDDSAPRELPDGELPAPVIAMLRTLLRLDPGDDAGARLLWRAGWREYRESQLQVAIAYWSELERTYPASGFARSGRYWTARAHEALGERASADELYREIADVPVEDFYRRHARARLERDPAPTAQPAPSTPREPWPWDAALARALWLSDRGLDDAALTELRELVGRAEPRARAALEGVVLARRGRRRDSIHSLSRAFPQLGRLEQASAPEAAVRLYYPTDYESIVRRFAGAGGIPAPLLFAMIRQESAFDPEAVSRSGARGLMQLMPATGRELAGRLRLHYSSQRLSDPEFNIQLGSTYFRQLLEMFDGNVELALAGYNAGPYRIKRMWRSEGSAAELDLFLEGLGLSETTRYVKRILLFNDTYQRLYGESA